MEKMRYKITRNNYYELQSLGRSKSLKGIVSENLGRTEFKTTSTTNGRKPSKRPQANPPNDDESDGNTTSEDDMNILKYGSSPLTLSTACEKSEAPKKSMRSTESQVPSTSPLSRVKPRPTFRGAEPPDTWEEDEANSPPPRPYSNSFKGSSLPSNQLALQQPKKSLSRENRQSTSPLEELNPNRVKRRKTSKEKRDPEPFPVLDDRRAIKSELKCRSSDRIYRDPAPFPMTTTSPRSQCKHSQSTTSPPKPPDPCGKENDSRIWQRFPLDSSSTQSLQRAPIDEEDEDDELALTDDDPNTILTYGAPRPFPMEMSQYLLEFTDQASSFKGSAKIDNDQRASKRSRPSLEPFDVFSSLSIEGDSHVDPASLCPYCDEPWPSSPSPSLLSLLERTKRKSYTDPRPGNAQGLKAPLAAFVEVCQRHRFEMTHLPLALERGWPTRLDFASLPNRIKGFKKKLGRFIDCPDESLFWREIRDNVKEVGRMKAVSVSGQYATFERAQPGYYGEQGSIIIHQTLYSLFPPDDISLTSIDPLTPDQFVTRVLVPETAVLLIQGDMRLSTKEKALRVLDESKKYGVAMFPEQAQGEEAAEIGEQLAKERAKERRKLLEERGEADADVQRQVDRERRFAKKAKAKDKCQLAAKGRRMTEESESDVDLQAGEEKDPSKTMRNAKPMRLKESGGASMLDGPSQLTSRPLKEQISESSIVSWRSNRSPSTSRDTHPAKPASRSSPLFKPSHKHTSLPPKPPTQEIHQDPEWVFDLRNVSPSPDREDVAFNEMPLRHKSNPKAQASESDSDVVVMNDDATPKPKQKPHRAHRSTINDSSDSEVSNQKTTPNLKAAFNEKVEKEKDQAGAVLGQTKRKKKGRTKDK